MGNINENIEAFLIEIQSNPSMTAAEAVAYVEGLYPGFGQERLTSLVTACYTYNMIDTLTWVAFRDRVVLLDPSRIPQAAESMANAFEQQVYIEQRIEWLNTRISQIQDILDNLPEPLVCIPGYEGTEYEIAINYYNETFPHAPYPREYLEDKLASLQAELQELTT